MGISRRLQVEVPRWEHLEKPYQPIAVDRAGADGTAKGAGSAESGLEIYQDSFRTVRRASCVSESSSTIECALREISFLPHREKPPVPKLPKSQRWAWRFFMVYTKEHVCLSCSIDSHPELVSLLAKTVRLRSEAL